MKSALTESDVIDYLKLTGPFERARAYLAEVEASVEAAQNAGFEVSQTELQQAADLWRAARNLRRAADTNEWLASNNVSVLALERYLERNLLLSKFESGGE